MNDFHGMGYGFWDCGAREAKSSRSLARRGLVGIAEGGFAVRAHPLGVLPFSALRA